MALGWETMRARAPALKEQRRESAAAQIRQADGREKNKIKPAIAEIVLARSVGMQALEYVTGAHDAGLAEMARSARAGPE